MSDLFAVSLSGLRAATASFGAAASHIARPSEAAAMHSAPQATAPAAPPPPSHGTAYDPGSLYAREEGAEAPPTIDLAEEMVKIAMAVQSFRANVAMMKAADAMARSTLDILS